LTRGFFGVIIIPILNKDNRLRRLTAGSRPGVVMNDIRKRSALLSAGILATVLAGFAAEENPPRFEFFLSLGPSLASGTATYSNEYDPHPGYQIAGSYARQTIAIDPVAGGYLAAGGTYYFGRRLGVRLSFFYESRTIGGENTPYDLLYLYTAMTPPDYIPVETSYARLLDWPSSEGAIREYGGSLALVLRGPVSDAFEFAVTGGLSLTSAGGRFHPLGFTDLWEGGHGVLFAEDYLVYLRLPPQALVGAVFSLEAAIRLSGHFWLRFEADYRTTGTYQGVPEIDHVLYYYSLEEADSEAMELIESVFSLQPLELSLSHLSFGLGIVFRR